MATINFGKKRTLSEWIQIVALFGVLAVLPLGSWYYLQSGLNYQKDLRAELNDYGSIVPFTMANQFNQPITEDSLKGKLNIISFINPAEPSSAEVIQIIAKMYDQFKARNDVMYLIHLLGEKEQVNDYSKSLMQKSKEFKDGRIHLLSGTKEEVIRQMVNFKIPLFEKGRLADGTYELAKDVKIVQDLPYFILADEKLNIRNYYDAQKMEDVKHLVEHTAILIPKTKKRR